MEESAWAQKIEQLPSFKNISHSLTHVNELLTNSEYRQLRAPKPYSHENTVIDDSNY